MGLYPIYGTHGVIWTEAKQAAATREQTVNYGKQWIGRMVTDCSGLIYWACMQLGEKVVHHATYLYTDWSRPKGKLVSIPVNAAGETKGRDDGQPIKPGTLVFLKGNEEKIHHTGVYIGDNTVIEAKGTKSGVTTSQLSHWEYWGELKVLDYTGAKTPESGEKPMSRTMRAVVNNPHNKLNVRKEPSEAAARVCQVLKGTIVDVVEQTNAEWWKISYNGKTGYTMAKYLQLQEPAEKPVAEEPVFEWYTEVEPVAAEPVTEEPQKKESLLDKIRGIFGGRKEEQPEEQPEEPPEDEEAEDAPFDKVVGPETVQAQLVGIAGDLDILTRLVNDAKATLNPDELVEILNALDKVLPEIQQAKDDMWTMITVG